mgnify:CR=1 FL=1
MGDPQRTPPAESSDIRWKQRFDNLQRAYRRLRSMLELQQHDPDSDVIRMALIKAYEFTFELSWKTLKDYLAYNGIDTRLPGLVHAALVKCPAIGGTLAKVDVTHVPFQPAAATQAAVSGQVPIASTSMPPAVPHAKAGKVRPIAVMSLKRSPALPDVPTVAELGYPGFEANTWFAMMAPAGTPAAVLDRMNAEVNKVLQARAINDGFAAQSLEAIRMNRSELDAYLAAEARKWAAVVQQTGAKVD